MKLARLRALTPINFYGYYRILNFSRNEVSPFKGIDTFKSAPGENPLSGRNEVSPYKGIDIL